MPSCRRHVYIPARHLSTIAMPISWGHAFLLVPRLYAETATFYRRRTYLSAPCLHADAMFIFQGRIFFPWPCLSLGAMLLCQRHIYIPRPHFTTAPSFYWLHLSSTSLFSAYIFVSALQKPVGPPLFPHLMVQESGYPIFPSVSAPKY